MKKNLKKLITLFLCIIAGFSTIMVVEAATAPKTFKATNYVSKKNPPIEFPATYRIMKTTTGEYVYCLYYAKQAPIESLTYTRGELITDNGMNYILSKSYGAKTEDEFFIYKSALQLYMVDKGLMPGPHATLVEFNSIVKKNNTAVGKQIKNLIADAKKAGANDTTAPTITVNTGTNSFSLDSTEQNYISNAIIVTSSTGSYNVSLTNAPAGSSVSQNGNKFTIKVPANSVTTLDTTISFKVSNSKDTYTAYTYNPSNSNYQPLALAYKDTKTASANGSLVLKRTVSIPVLKVDAQTGAAISGAELKITNSKGEVVKTWTSTTQATIVTGLKEGSYTLTETKAPEGYKAVETSIKFSIDKAGNLLDAKGNKIVKLIITNERKTGGVLISKQDITTKEELPGATLVVKDANGKVIEKWVSTDKPHYIEKLIPGKYTLTETIAPEGYILSTETITFTVKDDGKIETVTMFNKPKAKVVISKQDITTKEELPGATLVVKDYNGKVIDEWVSTDKPHYIENLNPGIYTLTETIAPEGYILSTETITFTVKDDGKIETVIMFNTRDSKEEIPVENTASFRTMTSSIIGSIIILAGSYIIFKSSKKKEVM